MTVAAVWTDDNGQSIWGIADTRITSARPSSKVRLTDSGTKLLSIPYTCRPIPTGDPSLYPVPYFSGSFGLAFAGNVTAALFCATTATTLFSILVSVEAKLPPKIEDLANAVGKIGQHFCRELMFSHNGSMVGAFECIVFGHCPRSGIGETFHLHVSNDPDGISMNIDKIDLIANRHFVIGSGKDRLESEIASIANQCDQRQPQKALQNLITQNALDVGGFTSLGRSTPFQFMQYWIAEPIMGQEPKAWRSFNGLDLDNIGQIGTCFFGGNGMTKRL